MTATAEPHLPWLAPIALACAIGVLAAVFVRAGESPSAWPELGASGADLLTPLGDPDDTQHDLWRRSVRVTLLRALDHPDRAARLARKTCAHYADASMAGLKCQDPTPTP